MAVLVNERDKLLSSTTPRLVDPADSDPLVVTASSPLLKYTANPASPTELVAGASIILYALTSRIGDVSWSIVGGPITGVTLSASSGSTVNLTYTNALAVDSVSVLASINNTNYSPASVQTTLNFTKQLPAKSIKNLTVYKRGTATPSTPTGGNYVFSSNTLVPPSGWSVSIPFGTDPVYSSTTQVSTYKDDSAVAINTSGWATPVLTVQNGATGDSVDIIFTRSINQPTTPSPSSSTPSGWYSNVDSVPATPIGGGIWACTGTKVAPATTYTWGTPVKQSGSTVVELTVFKRNVGTPATPTGGSYNFSTTTLTPPAGWSIGFPVGTDPVYTSRIAVSSSDPTATITITGTWTTPVLTVQNGTNGATGPAGQRGSVDLYVIGSSWSDTAANSAIYNATGSYVKYAGDKVTIYNNAGFAQTKYWDGISSWVTGQIIDGNLLVSGTVTSDKIGTNTISAANINVTKSGWNPATGSTTIRYNGVDYTIYSPSIFNNTNTNSGLAHAGMSGKVTGSGSYMFGVSGVAVNSGSGAATGIHGNSYGSGTTYGGVFNGGTADVVLSGSGKLQWGNAVSAILPPDGSTTKYLRADGTWAAVAVGSSGVTSFNSRTGAVTLNSTDVASAVAGTGVTLQANISGTAESANYASSAGNASTLGGYDSTNYIRGTGPTVTGAKTLVGYVPVIGAGTNVFIAIYL